MTRWVLDVWERGVGKLEGPEDEAHTDSGAHSVHSLHFRQARRVQHRFCLPFQRHSHDELASIHQSRERCPVPLPSRDQPSYAP